MALISVSWMVVLASAWVCDTQNSILGQDFSREQWGVSLETDLGENDAGGASGLAQSVFIFFKAKAVLA